MAWLATLGVAASARRGPLRAARGAFVASPFALAAAPLIVTRPEDPLATIDVGPLALTISGQGLEQFLTIAAKSWVSVQAAILLALTTPFPELVEALRRLRLPRIMVAIIGFMYRYLAVLGDEGRRLGRARASRSADPPGGRGGGSLRWRARVTGGLVGSLFLRSYERSERIYAAMQARGFAGELRTLPGRTLTRGEWLGLGIGLAGLVVFVALAHAVVLR